MQTVLIQSQKAKLYTTVHPRPEAASILFLHGGPGVPMNFSALAALLSPVYQVIVFDQRGAGRSPADADAAYTIDAYLEDIEAVARHFGLEKFHLFGHSWGGLYAQLYAQAYPQRLLSLFLCSPASGTGEAWKQTEREVMAFNKAHSAAVGWMKMGVRSLLGMLGSDAAYRALFKQLLENYNKDFDPAFTATDTMVENVRAAPINKTRPSIIGHPPLRDGVAYPFPILITYGKYDIYGPSKALVKNRFPKARFVDIERAGHIPWAHNPAMFRQLLHDFYGLK